MLHELVRHRRQRALAVVCKCLQMFANIVQLYNTHVFAAQVAVTGYFEKEDRGSSGDRRTGGAAVAAERPPYGSLLPSPNAQLRRIAAPLNV